MKALPEKWVINRKDYPKVQEWFTKTINNGNDYSDELLGWFTHYPSRGSRSYTNSYISVGYTEITFEDFKKFVLKEDNFVLPKKWRVKDSKIVSEWAVETFKCGHSVLYDRMLCIDMKSFPKFNSYKFLKKSDNRILKYTEITTEQFKQYVLKQEDMGNNIIGYKLKEKFHNEQIGKAVLDIEGHRYIGIAIYTGYQILDIRHTDSIERLKNAGVLDLWFEPVYGEIYEEGDYVTDDAGKNVYIYGRFENGYHYPKSSNISFGCKLRKCTPEEIEAAQIPNIEINGYKGGFFDNCVKFGCAEIDKRTFIGLDHLIDDNKSNMKSNKQIESVTIGKGTFTKDQIKQIAEYYLNKEK